MKKLTIKIHIQDKHSQGFDESWAEIFDCPSCKTERILQRKFKYCPACSMELFWSLLESDRQVLHNKIFAQKMKTLGINK